ncbi:hypothetical protein ElyMa_004287900 [Elysia marginata]|uniref:Uncharacterized protein n=1 Tax=Elysia marginata TaxID=1093978 RepID=A0AAV4GX73_9GAST|nr:hypothetical protein ElyMa_004287900 [Elysia marginata]
MLPPTARVQPPDTNFMSVAYRGLEATRRGLSSANSTSEQGCHRTLTQILRARGVCWSRCCYMRHKSSKTCRSTNLFHILPATNRTSAAV